MRQKINFSDRFKLKSIKTSHCLFIICCENVVDIVLLNFLDIVFFFLTFFSKLKWEVRYNILFNNLIFLKKQRHKPRKKKTWPFL